MIESWYEEETSFDASVYLSALDSYFCNFTQRERYEMASYAALLSLFHTLNNINKHPSPPISLDPEQLQSLTQNLTFFQDFFERHSSTGEEDDDVLESRIAAAAYAAEDLIETHIVDQIHHAGSTSNHWGEHISSVDLYGGLERVIQDMDLIKREVMEIEIVGTQHHPHLHTNSSGGPSSTRQSSTMYAFEEAMVNQVLDKLTGQQSSLQIIPIVGMGGIGKTTFARYIYSNSLIVHHFDILAWATISQEYSVPEILGQVLCQENRESEISENELGERVHKMLWGRRYLIVMDDLWNIEALDKVRCFFPDNNNGSRIMITTRLSNLAFELGFHVFRMKFLDEHKSWGLLCDTVFGKELGCPIELENTGKKIAKKCRGLPLSIVVIGGLLKKSNWTRAHWKYTLQNLNLLLNLEDGEYCLQIMRSSYKVLPVHLKPCFLYMGIFREDERISVTKLIGLWVAEGILKPTKDKRLEEVGEEYINELIDRNLIFVEVLRWNGKAKVCKIHDLLRDLCLREAHKQRFVCVLKHQWDHNIPQCMNMEHRICIHDNTGEKYSSALESAFLIRSLISTIDCPELVQSLGSKLLRIYSGDYNIYYGVTSNVEAIFKKTNLRYVSIVLMFPQLSIIPSSWFLLWNLQTLKVNVFPTSSVSIMAPSDIWEMPLLRHVVINGLELSDPLCGENDLILEDLHTLSHVIDFRLSREVLKRIPNLKKLKLVYQMSGGEAEFLNFGFNNIGHLTKLQSLSLSIAIESLLDREIYMWHLMHDLIFPHSLERLTLCGIMLNWEECTTKIGSLPLLQYLRLNQNACCGPVWETVEGQFCSLRFLLIDECYGLRYWRTEDTHFPHLEQLVLLNLTILEEIPLSIGDIPTLESILMSSCSKSAENSARVIKEEQLELGNTDLQIHIFGGGELVDITDAFMCDRETHDRFLDVMNDFFAQRIDIDGFLRAAKELFKGHPNLILGLNKLFLDNDEEEAP